MGHRLLEPVRSSAAAFWTSLRREGFLLDTYNNINVGITLRGGLFWRLFLTVGGRWSLIKVRDAPIFGIGTGIVENSRLGIGDNGPIHTLSCPALWQRSCNLNTVYAKHVCFAKGCLGLSLSRSLTLSVSMSFIQKTFCFCLIQM